MAHAGFRHRPCRFAVAVIFCFAGGAAEAASTVAIGQRGVYENSITPSSARDRRLLKRRGLVLECFYTQGGGETQQAVISGAGRYRHRVGTLGAMGLLPRRARAGARRHIAAPN